MHLNYVMVSRFLQVFRVEKAQTADSEDSDFFVCVCVCVCVCVLEHNFTSTKFGWGCIFYFGLPKTSLQGHRLSLLNI